MTSAKEKIVNILLIEDNYADSRLFQILFSKQKSQSVFHVITDGEEAAIFFEEGNEGHFEPDLIVLDLNIPKIDGKEILKRIHVFGKEKAMNNIQDVVDRVKNMKMSEYKFGDYTSE
jgi:DNA-binding response OmpR family regulator